MFARALRSSSRFCPARRSSATSSSAENSVSPAASRRVASRISSTSADLCRMPAAPASTARAILPVEARGQDQRREERVGLAQVLDQLDPLTVGEAGSMIPRSASLPSITRRASDRDPACATTSNTDCWSSTRASVCLNEA